MKNIQTPFVEMCNMLTVNHSHRFTLSIALLFFLGVGGVGVCALAAPPRIVVPHTDTKITLDGSNLEEVWDTAPTLEGFTPYRPNTNIEAPFSATGKVLYTSEALYFYVEVQLGHDDILEQLSPRDGDVRSDNIEIELDTFGNGRRGYQFKVNPAGVLWDGLTDASGEDDNAWDSLFDAQTHITETSWSAEIRIPFQSLRFPTDVDHFRMHLFVSSWKHHAGMSWAPIDRDANNWLPAMGYLDGLKNLEPGRTLEILPSLTAGWLQTGAPLHCNFDSEYGGFTLCGAEANYGVGLKWAITPAWTADMVFNPDFSQVEADPQQLLVNNRFAIFLEERRPFFLEGMDIFKYVYTRSINRPEFALKVTGSQGDFRVGALVAYDGEPPDSVSDSDFSVSESEEHKDAHAITSILRTQMDLGDHASIGTLMIDREYLDDWTRAANNQVIGIDAQAYLTPRLNTEAAFAWSHAGSLKDEEMTGYAAIARVVFKEDLYRLQTKYERVSQGFRHEAGYIPRHDYHSLFTKLDFFHRSDHPVVRVVSPGAYTELFYNDSGDVTERIVGANVFWMFSQHIFFFTVFEKKAELIAERWLDANYLKVEMGSGTLQALRLGFHFELGDAIIRDEQLLDGATPYLGWTFSPGLHVVFQPLAQWTLRASYNHRLLYRSYEGDILSDEPIFRLESSFFFRRDLDLRFIAEWDKLRGTLSNDILFSYKPNPLTVFFLGYREEALVKSEYDFQNRSVFMKFSYLFSI